MNTCIKCGREIPDGELFCNDCALNPGTSETVRKPALPIDESGVFCDRAELRYRLQYEIWQR